MVVRIAAIGCGDIAQRRHFPQIADMGGAAELVAVAARDPARLAACADRFGVRRCYTDPAAMLADPTIDAVMVLTAPDSHAHYAEMAVRAGKHVMVEKPLVRTVAEALRLRAAVLGAAKPVTVFALPHSATAELALVARLLHQGAIGEVTGVECHRGHRGPTHAGWFYNRALAGGGVLADLGIYGLTMIATLFGPAATMTASCSRRFDSRIMDDGSVVHPDVEDSALISLVLEGGIAASLNANWNGYLSHHHTRARTMVMGRAGMLHFGVADGGVYLMRADGEATPGSEPAWFDGHGCRRFTPEGGTPSLVREFVDRIVAGDTATRSLDIQVHVLEIIEKAYAAAAGGHAIPLVNRF